MNPVTIPLSTARRLAIIHQGLHSTAPFGRGKNAVLETIRQLGYVQIDTISVTERAHHHILWSRVPAYAHEHLETLQCKDRSIVEYWAHAAAYLPMEDYRYLVPTMHHFRDHHDRWPKAERNTMRHVMDRIRNEGPLMSRQFDREKKGGAGWWEWKPAKVALQRLFFSGELMVSHREAFQRVYDLPERVIPPGIDTSPPTREEYARYLITRTIRAHGIARPQEMAYLRKGMGAIVRKALNDMILAGEVLPVRVTACDGEFYTTAESLERSARISKPVRLLSPFDNLVIQRNRVSDLFGFDYQIECYVPKPKRKYGYYCLPILCGKTFLGRVDVKADRKTGVLHLLHLALEDKSYAKQYGDAMEDAFRRFAEFNGCSAISRKKG